MDQPRSAKPGPSRSPSNVGERKCKRIASFNFKGGVGKTTTCVNLAAALAFKGLRVVVIDGDAQCNLTSHLVSRPADNAAGAVQATPSKHGLKRRRAQDEADDAVATGGDPPELSATPPGFVFPDYMRDPMAENLPLTDVYSNEDITGNGLTVYHYLSAILNGEEEPVAAKVITLDRLTDKDVAASSTDLYLIPGSPQLNDLDWVINQLPWVSTDTPGKVACWLRLFLAIEAKYSADFIFVDLNPANSKLNFLAMLGCDFILPSTTAGLYDVSSCQTFLHSGMKMMFDFGKQMLKNQRELADANDHLVQQKKAALKWFPCKAKSAETPRLPKLLPFLMQRYKLNNASPYTVTHAATRWCNTLCKVILDEATYMNATGGLRTTHAKYQLKEMIYYNQQSHGGPITTLHAARKMMIPFLPTIESVITMSQQLRKPIVAISASEVRAFAAHGADRQSKIKWLRYAQTKFNALADTMRLLPLDPDFSYGH